jgi:hypothetical protein
MPHRYPTEVRHQVIELARSGAKSPSSPRPSAWATPSSITGSSRRRSTAVRSRARALTRRSSWQPPGAGSSSWRPSSRLRLEGPPRPSAHPATDLAGWRDRRRPQGLRWDLRLHAGDSGDARREGPNQLWMTDITEHPPARERSTLCGARRVLAPCRRLGGSKAPRRRSW